MLSKTAMLPLVKAFDWKAIEAGLNENPDLLKVKDKKGRNWLHLCCGVDVSDRDAAAVLDSIRLADLFLEHGLGINDPGFTEENFKATPLWYAIAFGKNIELAAHLLKLGCDPNYCLWAAAWNNDAAAIRLLIKHGAPLTVVTEDTSPFLAAVKWSRFEAAEELLKHGADPNYQDSKGKTALHYMRKKRSAAEHFEMVLRYGARES
jgi:hypothetical protein